MRKIIKAINPNINLNRFLIMVMATNAILGTYICCNNDALDVIVVVDSTIVDVVHFNGIKATNKKMP